MRCTVAFSAFGAKFEASFQVLDGKFGHFKVSVMAAAARIHVFRGQGISRLVEEFHVHSRRTIQICRCQM